MTIKQIFALLMLFFLLGCASQTAVPSPTPVPTAEPTLEPTAEPVAEITTAEGHFWWNDRVFYEVFVRSFYDSDGDGIGDLQGLISQLDYFEELGVGGLWLMPIMDSPSYHGYDVVDYYTINPDYGTNDDFVQLMAEAEARDIKIIVDLVINHTSTQHPWFMEARNPVVESPYREYYLWTEEEPTYTGPWGQDVWHAGRGGYYYYAVFWDQMPDLNFENPEVTAEIESITRFWLEDMGVDGFRLDAIKHLIEDGAVQENTPETLAWFAAYHDFYKEVNPEAFTVGEVWSPTFEVVKYVGDKVDVAFEFDTAEAILRSTNNANNSFILTAHQNVADNFADNQVATFITNHDQNRVMNQLLGIPERAKVAASLLLTGPGVPFIYYGEEIGQVGAKPDEDIRTPMQWSAEAGAGFTTGVAWRAPQADYPEVNVASQRDNPDSLFNHYRALIQLRNEHPALRYGDWQEVEVDSRRVYAALRHTEGETLLVLINLHKDPLAEYTLSLATAALSEGTAEELFQTATVAPPTLTAAGGFENYTPLELAGYTTYIIRLR